MKLSDLAKKPQLVQVTITDEELVKEFGEPIEFWTWDRQPMETFLKLASMDSSNYGNIVDAVRGLVLDEKGQPLLTGEVTLPSRVMMAVITQVVAGLGK